MKRLIFHSMLVLSESERAARTIKFHKRRTILKGPNDTGKSSLIKTLYWTFGAEPRNLHPAWIAANVASAVSFSLDDTKYRMLRDGGRFTLFDHNDRRIESFKRVTSELAPYFARLCNFPLRLVGRGNQEETQAPPAFMFLPFYFDQDSSWVSNWSGFDRLGQFANWRADVAQFHMGVRPAEYYIAKGERTQAQRQKARLDSETDVIRSVKKRLENELPVAQFDIDVDAFKAEIDELLAETAILQREEEKLRSRTVRLHNDRESLLQQVAITEAAVHELSKDFSFAAEQVDEVICPTCRTTHTNSFAERFYIARDEDRCKDLLTKLSAHLERTEEEIAGLSESLGETIARSERIHEILQRKRGEVTLHEIVQAESKKHLRKVLLTDMAALQDSSQKAGDEVSGAQERMDRVSDKKRHQEIRGFYMEKMQEFLNRLGVLNMREEQFKNLNSKIEESGSDQPRALLAYYFAVLHTVSKYSSSTFCPIVIDSPNQQDQDPVNWPKMVQFIADHQPVGSQVILGLVDEAGVDTGSKTIVLETKHHVLQRSEYSRVASEIQGLRDESFR